MGLGCQDTWCYTTFLLSETRKLFVDCLDQDGDIHIVMTAVEDIEPVDVTVLLDGARLECSFFNRNTLRAGTQMPNRHQDEHGRDREDHPTAHLYPDPRLGYLSDKLQITAP
jgi:hypothetical protein